MPGAIAGESRTFSQNDKIFATLTRRPHCISCDEPAESPFQTTCYDSLKGDVDTNLVEPNPENLVELNPENLVELNPENLVELNRAEPCRTRRTP